MMRGLHDEGTIWQGNYIMRDYMMRRLHDEGTEW